MGYWESAALQERLARLYRERYGIETGAGQFLLTCGASPALVMALSIGFEAGDRIAMARPGYVAYRNTVRALGMLPVEIPCGAERSEEHPSELQSLIRIPYAVFRLKKNKNKQHTIPNQ